MKEVLFANLLKNVSENTGYSFKTLNLTNLCVGVNKEELRKRWMQRRQNWQKRSQFPERKTTYISAKREEDWTGRVRCWPDAMLPFTRTTVASRPVKIRIKIFLMFWTSLNLINCILIWYIRCNANNYFSLGKIR